MKRKTVKIVALVIGIVFVLGLIVPLIYFFGFCQPVQTEDVYTDYSNPYKLSENIKKLDDEIKEKEFALNESKLRLSAAEELLKNKLKSSAESFRIMCEKGAMSYMDIIFSSKNLSDLSDRIVIARELSEYDKNMINSLNKIKGEINYEVEKTDGIIYQLKEKKANLEQAKKDLAGVN